MSMRAFSRLCMYHMLARLAVANDDLRRRFLHNHMMRMATIVVMDMRWCDVVMGMVCMMRVNTSR